MSPGRPRCLYGAATSSQIRRTFLSPTVCLRGEGHRRWPQGRAQNVHSGTERPSQLKSALPMAAPKASLRGAASRAISPEPRLQAHRLPRVEIARASWSQNVPSICETEKPRNSASRTSRLSLLRLTVPAVLYSASASAAVSPSLKRHAYRYDEANAAASPAPSRAS
jgi:hypothetical protein